MSSAEGATSESLQSPKLRQHKVHVPEDLGWCRIVAAEGVLACHVLSWTRCRTTGRSYKILKASISGTLCATDDRFSLLHPTILIDCIKLNPNQVGAHQSTWRMPREQNQNRSISCKLRMARPIVLKFACA